MSLRRKADIYFRTDQNASQDRFAMLRTLRSLFLNPRRATPIDLSTRIADKGLAGHPLLGGCAVP